MGLRRAASLLAIASLAAACGPQAAPAVADPPAHPSPSAAVPSGSVAPTRPPLQLDGADLRPCQIGQMGSVAALCGTFTVPEDPATPDGRTLDLRVAVIPAVAAAPEPDPVFMLAGGPGGSATATLAWTAATFDGIHATRDIVLVDQRGVGGSNAMLVGPAPDVTGLPAAEAEATLTAWVSEQLGRFDADPAFYTTSVAMDDLDLVRDALGYERINLFGASYGATAAQYYIRQHEDRLRAVVLDGATLLDVPVFERIAPSSQSALDQLLGRCAADAACASAYPDLTGDFELAMTALADGPIATTVASPTTGDPVVVDASAFAAGVHAGLLGAQTSAQLPWFIHVAGEGRWDDVAAALVASGVVGQADPATPVMSAVIRCSEAWARYDPAEVERLGEGSYYVDAQLAAARSQALSCSYVPPGVVPDDDAAPARTDVPVLLVVGSADPQDPPANIASAGERFSNSATVVADGHGHTVAHLGCMPAVVDAFIAAGTVDGLDTTCVASGGMPLSPFRLP